MGDAAAASVRYHLFRAVHRWRLIATLAAIGLALGAVWTVLMAGPQWTATSALTAQSQDRAPEQDGVLALGYVNYFNQDSYQEVLRSEAGIPANITLSAEIAATSPILYVRASGDSEQEVRSAAAVAADRFRSDIRANLQAERDRQIGDIQTRVDQLTRKLGAPGMNDGIVSDQIRSLQGRMTDLAATTTNQLNQLQPQPGVDSSGRNPVLAILAGALGGALVGVLAALLLSVLDRRIRSSADAGVRAGLDPVIDLLGRVETPETRRRLGNLINAASLVNVAGPVVLAVVSPRRGQAAGMLARRVAALATGRRKGVLLVDTDFHESARASGLADILDRRSSVRSVIRYEPSGVGLIGPGDLRGRTPDLVIDPDRMAETVAEFTTVAGVIVLMAPPLLEAAESQVICAAADRVLLVAERDVTTVQGLTESRGLLDEVHAHLAATVVLDGASGDEAQESAPATVADPAALDGPTAFLTPHVPQSTSASSGAAAHEPAEVPTGGDSTDGPAGGNGRPRS